MFEQIDTQTIATVWFGFDASGNPVWQTGVLKPAADASFGGTLAQGVGPQFGAAYDPAAFHLVPQGNLSQTTFQCASASAKFTAIPGQPGYLTPSLALSRITYPLGVPMCTQ